ncbi:hypothetical protein PFISCL1PPCAC_24210, partial [Pristionchus fissidentatus]
LHTEKEGRTDSDCWPGNPGTAESILSFSAFHLLLDNKSPFPETKVYRLVFFRFLVFHSRMQSCSDPILLLGCGVDGYRVPARGPTGYRGHGQRRTRVESSHHRDY